MRRSIAVTGLALSAALTLSACGGLDTGVTSTSSTTSSAGGSATGSAGGAGESIPRPAACDEDSPYIAVALPNLTNPYYVAMKAGFEDAGTAAGYTVEVQIAGDDDAQQLGQVQAMLEKKPCALALNAVKSAPAAAIVKAANDAGVPVFTVNVTVDPDALTSQGATIVQYLGADNAAGGTQVGEQVLKDLGADATLNIGFITEPDEVPVVIRDEGFEKAVSADANAKVVAKVDGNVKPDDSLAATAELLQGNPDVNVLFASTGPAAYGALQAIGGTDVKVYGFCAADEPLTDAYPACVAQEPNDYGKRVVEQIKGWLGGATPEPEILRPLKLFVKGQTPAAGEVG
ncbi:substrate-binding domain-containing protein [Nakamurella deserti]|uniref:substrate-binding domain-containing protein n=1 Tax=Nakamurella deserti TaxID=2164074 RepID=UPI000DBE3AF6|nr:substrate-binding domain-containing protein [Nakamurella deserti]